MLSTWGRLMKTPPCIHYIILVRGMRQCEHGWELMLGSKGKWFELSLLGEAAALQLGEAVTL